MAEEEKEDRENVDAVLQVSVSANGELYEQIRRDDKMCQALRELMKDELDQAERQGRREGTISGAVTIRQEPMCSRRVCKADAGRRVLALTGIVHA